MEETITGKTALVTGASGGLGAEFAEQLAKRGCDPVLVARRASRMNELAGRLETHYGVDARVIPMDLTGDGPRELYERIRSIDLQVDILVNNAGFGLYGSFADIDWEDERDMLELDIISLTHLTKLFVRDMLDRDFGYILQVSSIGAFQPTPTYATYSAAKSYVLSFGQALDYELRNSNVSCTVLSPGVTRTRFMEVAGQSPTLYQRLVMMDPDRVADIGIEAMSRRKRSVVPGLMNKMTVWSMKLLPERVKTFLAHLTMTVGQR